MKVKCIYDYLDLQLGKVVRAGDEFEVSEARGKELSTADNKAGIPLVEILTAPTNTRKKKEA